MEPSMQNEFQKQLQQQQIEAEKRKLAMPLIEKKMNETLFPKELLSERWRTITKRALRNSIPISNKATLIDFANALESTINPEGSLSLTQFQVLANCFDAVSPEALGLSDEEYVSFVKNDLVVMVDRWKELIEKVNSEVEKEVSMKLASMAVPKGNILKPVKAEA